MRCSAHTDIRGGDDQRNEWGHHCLLSTWASSSSHSANNSLFSCSCTPGRPSHHQSPRQPHAKARPRVWTSTAPQRWSTLARSAAATESSWAITRSLNPSRPANLAVGKSLSPQTTSWRRASCAAAAIKQAISECRHDGVEPVPGWRASSLCPLRPGCAL